LSVDKVPELLQKNSFDRRSGAGDHFDVVEFRAPGLFLITLSMYSSVIIVDLILGR
jgi:hypothetical protein